MESSRIFIRGLPPHFDREDFETHFSKQANVTDVKLIPHRRIGYVGYKTPEDAARAVKYHNKTFIRMSRVGVELARSVDEQYALRPAANATYGLKRKYGEIKGDAFEKPREDAQSKRHPESEGGKVDEGKSKLQEFLEVMQPPSRSKIWENQAASTAQILVKPILLSEMRRTANARSDEEYEPVPKKQKGERKEAGVDKLANQPTGLEDRPLEATIQENAESPPVTKQETEETTNEAPAMMQAASDADWLRSRTSRLLGLLDDNFALKPITLPDDSEEQDTVNVKLPQPTHSGDMSGASFQTDQDDRNEQFGKIAPRPSLEDAKQGNGRLFVRNLAYTTTEDALRRHFESGNYGTIKELHLPIDSRTRSNKGFAHIQYAEPAAAAIALQNLDGRPFQGRLLHVIPANAKKEAGLDDFAIHSALSKLPLKKQQQIKRKAEAASSIFNWNSMYMNSDAVISSMSDRLGVSKSDLLDATSSDAAVKQAHAETQIIQETKSYFTTNGVDLDAFKRQERGDTAILVKNFSYGTKPEELRKLFEPHGLLTRLLMPPCGTIAILEFDHPDHARSAFGSLAYRKFKDSVLFLEKAPKGLFEGVSSSSKVPGTEAHRSKPMAKEKDGPQEPVNTLTLFVRNLSFATTAQRLREIFQPLGGLLSARVKTKPNPRKPGQHLSMGFGFLEFKTKDNAQAALLAMDGYKLDGHELLIRASHRAIDAAEERRTSDQARKMAARKTKIIIKNLPFEASRKDVRSLFGAYGQLRSVRVPKKFDSSTRGFAFADFVTAREAENAMNALRDTHLLGRRLVLEFAAEDAIDPEQEIEKMQQKVGKQADKVALQKLAGTARKKFDVEGGEELD